MTNWAIKQDVVSSWNTSDIFSDTYIRLLRDHNAGDFLLRDHNAGDILLATRPIFSQWGQKTDSTSTWTPKNDTFI